MLEFVPLQPLDDFIQNYSFAQVLVVAFILSVLGSFPLSKKLLSLNVVLFGVLFLLVPATVSSVSYKLLGVALIVIGPILFTTARD
ncbi:hypothetical protein [Halalkalicoccus jeotgali]|uniref:DUF8006 domain-containing protein n=1 Tax=Halalkalicoccus jeotgali (strain DSM 18796 / CECT 7217 / JCM 14584 / KCTC 4019 / B3) TaxID=795797 RepID=D8J7Z6_HALJB|nr:hypothetical protein [Halalkalicoccus jeotgali]ADJ14109.1 hypothetical protein HacjB3_03590 [Halalkalicoccus jeotgali B3]ELY34709.1 hypothetical protein C497_15703 [Halalkalicoccus jeotgali B3]